MVNEIRINVNKLEFEDLELGTTKTLKQLAEVSLTGAEVLTNKTLTIPVIASLYQDAGKTKTVTMPASTDTLVGKATTDTLTNKRITKRVVSIASHATPTPNGDITDVYTVTALAVNATFGAVTGTPTIGQTLIIRIKDDNVAARVLAWNNGAGGYRAGTDIALPLITVKNKTMYLGFIYNVIDTKWDLIAFINNI